MADDAIIKIEVSGGGGGGGSGGGGSGGGGGGGRGSGTPSSRSAARSAMQSLFNSFAAQRRAQARAAKQAQQQAAKAARQAQQQANKAARAQAQAAKQAQQQANKAARAQRQAANRAKAQAAKAARTAAQLAKQGQQQAAKTARTLAAQMARNKKAYQAGAIRTGRLETQEQKKREREILRANKEKAKLAKVPTTFDSILDVAEKFRGTIGGAMGTLFGATLDMISAFRHMQKMAVSPSTVIPEAIPLNQPLDALKAPPGSISYATVPTKKVQEATVPPAGDPAGPDKATEGAKDIEAIPVIGWIVAAGVAAVKVLQAFRDSLTGAIKSVGDFATQMINPDANPANIVAMIGKQMEGIGDQLTSFGGLALIAAVSGPLAVITVPLAATLGIFSSSLGAAVGSLAKFTGALDGLVERYKNLNPTLAQITAQAEVRQALNDIRRAETAGPVLAQYVQLRSELQQKVEDAKIRMLQQLLPLALVAFAQIEKALPLLEGAVSILVAIGESIPGMAGEIAAIRARMDAAAREALEFDPTAAVFEGFLHPGEVRGRGGRRGVMTPDL